MPETSKIKRLSRLKAIQQISENHCGPAVVQILLNNLGVETTQELITKAAGAEKTIDMNGTRVDQLAKAVTILSPATSFWVKENSNIRDIKSIINDHDHAVGIEWQGLFEDNMENETEDEDYGHYSVVSRVDESTHNMIVIDPYKDFIDQARIIPIDLFEKRWWDWNGYIDEKTGKIKYKKDDRLIFIITDSSEDFPAKLGMVKLS